MTNKNAVCICVCTCQRPRMLEECLRSLSQLDPIDGVRTEIAVIDNEPESSQAAREAAERFGAHYRHQPERGIPQARNKALDAAREMGATHLAFIDDDETAAPDWLACLWAAMRRYDAGAIQGYVEYVYPENAQPWRRRGENTTRRLSGTPLGLAATNNVLFSLNAAGGLRFDESLRFLGGEDSVFFDAFHKRGERIVFCAEARTFETVPPSRVTIAAQARRSFRRGFCAVREARLMGNPNASAARIAKRLLAGALKIAVSPLCLAGGKNFALHALSSGSRNLAYSVGCIASIFGRKSYDYYRNPTGY